MKSPIAAFAGSPPALGPYSLGVVGEGKFVFVSGMVPFDAAAGKIQRGTVAEQTEIVITNIRNVLAQAGATLADVVSCRVYLSELNPETFKEMNEVYGKHFGESKPARATVGAQLLGFDVEIECVAVLNS
ncbi:MAG: hypothetical protein BGO12_02660 [Verrucomicrobia bacterium 61-8]|jgi:2-iminobutanoate/2-iminopropanoate deaminase|nr:MAG: hypothetical protein BGO12_02660 [Verrucomicrobia bacterium 61-8]PTX96987.1 deaminase [Spartobacteria bacterium LR76]